MKHIHLLLIYAMKNLAATISALLVLLTLSFSAFALTSSERRIALVIGNSAYKFAPLKNPVNDAIDLSKSLSKLGFSVNIKINADQRSMEEVISQFGKDLVGGGVGLFYFAGHGIQVEGRNYLVPIGANIHNEFDVKYESVDAGRILGNMEYAGNSLNIIILDACRNNPFSRGFRSSVRGLAKMDAPTGSILAFSTAPGSVAADGIGQNGLYTSVLLKYILEKGLMIEECFKKVRIEVMAKSNNSQVPWESSSLTGNFYFLPTKKPKMNSIKVSDTLSAELLYWESVKDSNEIIKYKSYLNRYPNGIYKELAEINIRNHKNIKEPIDKNDSIKGNNVKSLEQASIPKNSQKLFQGSKLHSNKIKLSFLPSYFVGNPRNILSKDQQYKCVIKAISKNNRIELIYSYKDDPDSVSYDNWFKNKRKFLIDVDKVVNFCKQLGSDFAMIMRTSLIHYNYRIEISLIDINEEKMIHHAKTSNIGWYTAEFDIEKFVISSIETIDKP